jgi:exopolysaccharide biosynthesis polyprenyl glycosylphosphotransferase
MSTGNFALRRPANGNGDHRSQLSLFGEFSGHAEAGLLDFLPEGLFRKVLSLERKRSERSRQRFVLMLVHTGGLMQAKDGETVLGTITDALCQSTRETDLRGWYEQDAVVGAICTNIGPGDVSEMLNALHSRLCSLLRSNLNLQQMNEIHISFHVFPEDLDVRNGGRPADIRLYPDLWPHDNAAKTSQVSKRVIDVLGSLVAIVLLSPLFMVIALVVKLTSKGPILFKQERLGLYGRRFTFWKFRSMYVNNDAEIHREFVSRFISSKENEGRAGSQERVYKIQDDPRVTPVGRFLRKSSLDELPQFFNVLLGHMSLVGPRPPIPYEIEGYDIWHRRRFLEVKPGITGLWQVEGRSRTTFDEMVRLDLKYAKTWSPWLDIQILLRTPAAVVRGDGAY